LIIKGTNDIYGKMTFSESQHRNLLTQGSCLEYHKNLMQNSPKGSLLRPVVWALEETLRQTRELYPKIDQPESRVIIWNLWNRYADIAYTLTLHRFSFLLLFASSLYLYLEFNSMQILNCYPISG